MKTTLQDLYPDIWHDIFDYFNPVEIFYSFLHVTTAADEVLFNRSQHLRLRRLVLTACVTSLPDEILFNQIISLELHQESYLHNIEKFIGVRELKLVGQAEWIICLLRKMSYVHKKVEHLVLVIPGINPLFDILECITHLLSLRRLGIYANELEEKIRRRTLCVKHPQTEYFSLHSCSHIRWNDLPYILSVLSNINSLDITLFTDRRDSFTSFTFSKVRYMCLTLIEVPFDYLIQLMNTMPSLVKLKLKGLIDAEGFVINDKWLCLLESCCTLDTIIVNLSLERDRNFFCIDTIQTNLRKLNLRLKCIDDDYDCYLNGRQQYRWWNLTGIIIRYHEHIL